jgi:hypothetical protein
VGHSILDGSWLIPGRHSTYCPRAFELANHFAEWTGFECDYNLLPTTSTRLAFIRGYLLAHHDIVRERDGTDGTLPPRVTQAEVDRVMAEVDAFRGFPGFYWQVPIGAQPTPNLSTNTHVSGDSAL